MPLRLIVNYGRDLSVDPRQDRPMAGIQTGLLGLCSALARRGHDVHLFGHCSNPGRHEGVFFHGRGELARYAAAHPADVLLVVPEVLPLLLPVRARARVVWSLNAFEFGDCALAVPWAWAQGIGSRGETARLYPLALLHSYADRIVVGSQWQARYMAETSGIPGGKFTVAYLGVSLEHYRGPAPARHRHRLVYTSQARRGLDVLLRLLPRVRSTIPEAELHIFGCEYRCADVSSHLQEVLPGATGPGVFWRGALSKSALAQELRSAAVMAYPCTLKETFCLAVAEAQAAGLPVVTSDRAALAERVSDGADGFLIPGRPGKPPGYEEAFVQAVVRLLRDDDLWVRMGAEAAAKAHRLYDGEAIADGWEQQLTDLARGRDPLPPPLAALDLLDPRLLTVTEGEASARVPPALAGQWLRQAWVSYGYDPRSIPGLPPE
jgi:glycosyltransferase involved in cell wall biosynthesis